MAKPRDFHYVVPMPLERATARLRQIEVLGIQLDITEIDADTIAYHARRMTARRSGAPKMVDETRGQMRRIDDALTRVEPVVKVIANWQLMVFYLGIVLLGVLVTAGIAMVTAGMVDGFGRRALAGAIIYIVLFLMLQPQRLVFGSAGDARFGEFVQDVLKGPYADPRNLYEQYFTETRYWETRDSR